MKVICLISHEVPLEKGKFLRYEAGKEYELERYPEVYFSPVYTREEREASYNAGVIMNNTNACSMKGYEISPVWEDEIINDKGEITGTEHGIDQEVGISSVK